VNNWLFFLTSKIGPNHKEAVHFTQEAPEKIPYSIERFTNKTTRLYLILDRHLTKHKTDYIVGSKWCVSPKHY
jgi:glutathione S-transferase